MSREPPERSEQPQAAEAGEPAAAADAEPLAPLLYERLSPRRQRLLAGVLFALTCASTTWAGAYDGTLRSGLEFSLPLMAILLAHELGHFVAARIHRVPASPPLFVPMPMTQVGTLGAFILMGEERIASRNALLDIGAAGPLAGLLVAVPVLAYGIAQSGFGAGVGPHLQEGHSLLYLGLLHAIKGPAIEHQDIALNPMGFAGWVGLLVTMINLIPTLQLDGGHVAYALLGERYDRLSRAVRHALLPLAIGVAAAYGLPAFLAGKRGDALMGELSPALAWLMWWGLLTFMGYDGKDEHPRTDPGPLSPTRRVVACLTLALFVLLFMPAWMRDVIP
jgi:membrane-associated protease RseP (regulator of RpoE activity)